MKWSVLCSSGKHVSATVYTNHCPHCALQCPRHSPTSRSTAKHGIAQYCSKSHTNAGNVLHSSHSWCRALHRRRRLSAYLVRHSEEQGSTSSHHGGVLAEYSDGSESSHSTRSNAVDRCSRSIPSWTSQSSFGADVIPESTPQTPLG